MAECPVCNVLAKTCEELGDRGFCVNLIEDLKKDKITEEQLINKITKRFGPDKFKGAWDRSAKS